VVDQQGRAITSLQSNDFVVYEDGVRRPILHFEPADTPFSLVLLLDMSGSTINFRQQIRRLRCDSSMHLVGRSSCGGAV